MRRGKRLNVPRDDGRRVAGEGVRDGWTLSFHYRVVLDLVAWIISKDDSKAKKKPHGMNRAAFSFRPLFPERRGGNLESATPRCKPRLAQPN